MSVSEVPSGTYNRQSASIIRNVGQFVHPVGGGEGVEGDDGEIVI